MRASQSSAPGKRARDRTNAISQLSLGDLGWIQITSFILTGLLAVAGAGGVRRALKGQKSGTWGAILVGTFMRCAGVIAALAGATAFGWVSADTAGLRSA